MEPHPVPQNIIDVEFKLFGSFTLKQFSKILIGCIVGVGLFFININPLIKFPLILISVIIGIGLAIIPNLMVWMTGFLKSIFISPRYVWVKQPSTPELFAPKINTKSESKKDLQSSLAKRKLSIDEIPLNSTFQDDVIETEDTHTSDFFMKAYETIYGKTAMKPVNNSLSVVSQSDKTNSTKGFASQFLSRAVQSIDISLLKSKSKVLKTRDEYLAELEKLRLELNSLNKNDFNYQERYKEIVAEMNTIYSEFKSKLSTDSGVALQSNSPQVVAVQNGKVINGIVVSQDDNPISNAEIYLKNMFFNKTYKTITQPNGRFTTHIPIPQGEYDIKIIKSGMRFHNYKIKISNQKPPAYKFREK